MYNLIKEIRGQELEGLAEMLKKRILSFDENFDGMMDFRLHHQNKRFVHFLLARITDYIERQSGYPSKFQYYVNDRTTRSGTLKPFEIEHIWSDKFDDHRDEFSQREDFVEYGNLLGALILLPKGINQSYGADSYQKKLNYYCRENLLAQSLSQLCYEKNPPFLNFIESSGLQFKAHNLFKKEDITGRHLLYKKICEQIWDIKGFDELVKSEYKIH